MPLTTGSRLGPYEVVGLLGAGGMGEVYRAHDLRLGRTVALKVLPSAFTEDPDRLRRFEHEARTASALNHPAIPSVHDVGVQDGVSFLVLELLEGQTLRELLYLSPDGHLMAVSLGAGPQAEVAAPRELFAVDVRGETTYDIDASGERFLFCLGRGDPPPILVAIGWSGIRKD